MKRRSPEYSALVRSVIEATELRQKLATTRAVVWERIASGGGATNWYDCPDPSALAKLEEALTTACIANFYFGSWIRRGPYGPDVLGYLEQELSSRGHVIAGVLRADGLSIDGEIIESRAELFEWLDDRAVVAGSDLFYGRFPPDDVDTLIIRFPDEDGVFRPHAY